MDKTFAVHYKLRYGETIDWDTEYLKASNKALALKKFAKLKKISASMLNHKNEWEWEEGVWAAEFVNIKQVIEIPCPNCDGTGIIHI